MESEKNGSHVPHDDLSNVTYNVISLTAEIF